jgi:hypothetical protein
VARIRTIKPEFFTSADVCSLPPLARLLYVALWCEADREGRLVWNPRTFKIRYLPEDACDIGKLCDALIAAGLLVTYQPEENGETFAYIPTFTTHQQINNRETESRFPEPNDASVTRGSRVSDASVTPLVRKGREGKGREGNSRPTRMPDGWAVPEDWITEAAKKKPGTDWRSEAERFAAHHSAKGSTFVNWKSAWWTWVSSPYQKTSANGSGSQRRGDQMFPEESVIPRTARRLGSDQ